MPTILRFHSRRIWCAALFLVGLASVAWGQGGFVQRAGGTLTLNGSPFRFGGTNSYPLMYSSASTVDQVLGTVVNSNLRVVRMWAFCEVPCQGSFILQSLNTSTGAPAYNDAPITGLDNVDYVVSAANKQGIKLIMTLANNWHDFGGMDQYVRWRAGPQYHDQFYTDSTIRQWYKNWISHVLNHVNTVQGPSFGVAYKDDPTIMAWELANEPECGNDGLPTSGNCTNQTIISWITDAAAYIKSIDSNHLVSVGDEGFFCEPNTTDYFTDCANGVDSQGFSSVPDIDLVGFHLYPDSWGKSIAWSETYITDHEQEATTLGKPLYMGEFGLLSGNAKEAVYNDWTNLVFNGAGSGAMFWDILPGTPQPSGAESASAFDEEAGSPVFFLMSDFAQMMAGSTQQLPPVAGYQWASTPEGQGATLNILSNDVAYGGATIDPTTIDLDPNTPDQQTSFTVNGGVFNVVGQTVEFAPQAGFVGSVTGSYTVEDSNHQLSNVGYLFVNVSAAQTRWTELESFESGTDGWGPGPTPAAGTVAFSPSFHTDGSYSLQVSVTAGGWFGVAFPAAVDLSKWPSLAADIATTSVGTSSAFAFQSGSNNEWCQNSDSTWQSLALFGTTTLTIQLQPSTLKCYLGSTVVTTAPDLTSVRALYIYFGNPGTYYVDNLRAAPGSAGSAPLPTISGVGNSAGGQAGVSAGTYISIYGSNFAPSGWPTSIWSDYVVNGQLPTTLASVSVKFGGTPAYIYYLSPTQINVLAPNLGTGSTSVTVTTPAGISASYPVNSAAAQPAFFPWPGNQVVATDASYNWLVRNGTFPGTTTAPAKPGETVILWGTGFGATTPAAPAGQVVPAQTYSVNGVVVTVGTIPVQATTALSLNWSADCKCYTAAGVYQIVITVPSTLANGDYPIVATVDSVQSPSGVNLTVQQ